jgi:hypothetical protein
VANAEVPAVNAASSPSERATGREAESRLTPEPFEAAALWMASVGAQWDRRLGALRNLLEPR